MMGLDEISVRLRIKECDGCYAHCCVLCVRRSVGSWAIPTTVLFFVDDLKLSFGSMRIRTNSVLGECQSALRLCHLVEIVFASPCIQAHAKKKKRRRTHQSANHKGSFNYTRVVHMSTSKRAWLTYIWYDERRRSRLFSV